MLTPVIGRPKEENPIINDWSLLKVLRECTFVVTPRLVSIYAVNTRQFCVDDVISEHTWRSKTSNKCDDTASNMVSKLRLVAENYLIDTWKTRINQLFILRERGCFVTPSIYSTIHNMVPRWEYANKETVFSAINSITCAMEMDENLLYNSNCCSDKKIMLPESDLEKVRCLKYALYEICQFDSMDIDEVKVYKESICNLAKIFLMLRGGNFYRTARMLSWENRIELPDRCSYGDCKVAYMTAIREFSQLTPDEAILVDNVQCSYYVMTNEEQSATTDANNVLVYFTYLLIEQNRERRSIENKMKYKPGLVCADSEVR